MYGANERTTELLCCSTGLDTRCSYIEFHHQASFPYTSIVMMMISCSVVYSVFQLLPAAKCHFNGISFVTAETVVEGWRTTVASYLTVVRFFLVANRRTQPICRAAHTQII